MDDVSGDGHCLYAVVLTGIADMQQGVAYPARQLRDAQERQRGGEELSKLTIGALGEMKVYAWKLQSNKTYHFSMQRVSDEEIVLCISSGPVSSTHRTILLISSLFRSAISRSLL
jgi:hypothetical protein